jgi:hypothetical protein
MAPRGPATGWIRRALRLADGAAQSLHELDADVHGTLARDEPCGWCRERVALLQALPRAWQQLVTMQVEADKMRLRKRRRKA